ncbi:MULTISPECIES: hypothetical protein [Vagococcus]|uniref:Uncharacterized protein n=1 Tax=Vagococcus fluvialis bH819 TaxID=1255619 RepID=A0A1X6WS60_9ENTE|nr:MULTISPECIES: hypothetical protein [Vagococcus]SLM87115.1 hypothetical protein FM121_13535 [Vagococcus fluvialis bH819]HCM90604.1 hypothetical protein [Vagococcus sp.]
MKKELTFASVKNGEFELVYQIASEVGERYEDLTSFRRGRDFNVEVKGYIIDFVSKFQDLSTSENENELNERLVQYNKLVVDLRTSILQGTTIPSVMICGGANYPVRKKEKELARIHEREKELYSKSGKHAKFLNNTRKMFDPVLLDQQVKTEKMRKERAEEKGWQSFYKELNHDELVGYGIDLENNRVYIKTDGKPCDETRTLLKKGSLRWSPKNERWQRILTDNAIYSIIRSVFNELELEVNVTDFK